MMKPIPSTAEILAYKVLNRGVDKTFINWAVDMLRAGFDTEYVVELAGASLNDNQFELQALATKALMELGLGYNDKNQIIKNYAHYLLGLALSESIATLKALRILRKIYIELGYESYLYDFDSLCSAKEDLADGEMQWYWVGADSTNIDSVIHDYFVQWLLQNPVK
jgi:hypothetical protein